MEQLDFVVVVVAAAAAAAAAAAVVVHTAVEISVLTFAADLDSGEKFSAAVIDVVNFDVVGVRAVAAVAAAVRLYVARVVQAVVAAEEAVAAGNV
jgi:multisubunit Na+/H+ antiporter MnhB subunit